MRGVRLSEVYAEDDVAALVWLVDALPYDSATKRGLGEQLPTDRLLMDLWAALVQDFHPLDPARPTETVDSVHPPTLPERLVQQQERRNRMGGKPLNFDAREGDDG